MRKHSNSSGEKPCSFSRFSLQRLLYSSPLMSLRHPRSTRNSKQQVVSSSPESNCHDVEACSGTSPRVFVDSFDDPNALYECPLCCADLTLDHFPKLLTCAHRSCLDCQQQYLRIEISESRVALTCPECPEPLHPTDIRSLLKDEALYAKYEDFMVRRVLSVEPDTRWCPTPDCGFAVIASGCASCPKLRCGRPGCASYFCYHCKASWHPNQTCDAARAQRSPPLLHASSASLQNRDDLKACPRCQVLILKMDDGSCNHMTCAVCGSEFCWLCLKEISDLHYLSPSGCTFWGTKPWSRKKKILWQLGTLVGAPVGIALVAGIAIPAMIIGIPVWVGRKLFTRYEHLNKYKRNLIVTGGVVTSILVAPVLAGLAVGIGVPILLFYVYGVVPVSLCRSGGCGVSTSPSGGVRFDFDDEEGIEFFSKGSDPDAVSHPNVSIGEASDKDSVSMLPLTGSIASNTRSFITQSSRGTATDESHQVRNSNDDGSASERVRFDDNVSIIEHTPPVVTTSSRNRVSSTLRSLFFKNSSARTGANCASSMKRTPLAPFSKGGRKLPKIPTTCIASGSSKSGGSNSSSHNSSSTEKRNEQIIVEVKISDLHLATTSSPSSVHTHDNADSSSCVPRSSTEVKQDLECTVVNTAATSPSASITSPTSPATSLPATPLPSPPVPSTSLPSASIPFTSLPSKSLPSTTLPSASLPSTSSPSKSLPSTTLPSASIPSTSSPSKSLPSTSIPSTSLASASLPCSSMHSTSLPSASIPSTTLSSKSLPSTIIPSTSLAASLPCSSIHLTSLPSASLSSTPLPSSSAASTSLASVHSPAHSHTVDLGEDCLQSSELLSPSHSPSPAVDAPVAPPKPKKLRSLENLSHIQRHLQKHLFRSYENLCLSPRSKR